MPVFSAEQLQSWTSGRWTGGAPASVCGFSNDTRTLKPGELFVALKTGNRDGHDFLREAAAAGASCALVSRAVADSPIPLLEVVDTLESLQRAAALWREKLPHPVYAVTGSVGKTSTKDLLRNILGPNAHATHANLNNLLGVPLTLLASDTARSASVIEAGMSEPGELERSAWVIRPDIAVVTAVQPAHLQGLGSLEAIAREKSSLCRQISARGVSVFPTDCLAYEPFRWLLGRRVPVAFGDAESPPVRDGVQAVARARLSREGQGHRLNLFCDLFGEREFTLGPVSDGMARNGALAATAALLGGAPERALAEALAAWTPSAGRGELREWGGRLFYIDCYNASPASMLDSAEAFVRRTPEGKARLFVLGGMNELGGQAAGLHREVGERLPLREGDELALFGGLSAEIGVGARAAGFPSRSIRNHDSLDSLREAISGFHGSVMLKGSRGYALERALPPGAGGEGVGH